jgi:hypothetical protein
MSSGELLRTEEALAVAGDLPDIAVLNIGDLDPTRRIGLLCELARLGIGVPPTEESCQTPEVEVPTSVQEPDFVSKAGLLEFMRPNADRSLARAVGMMWNDLRHASEIAINTVVTNQLSGSPVERETALIARLFVRMPDDREAEPYLDFRALRILFSALPTGDLTERDLAGRLNLAYRGHASMKWIVGLVNSRFPEEEALPEPRFRRLHD